MRRCGWRRAAGRKAGRAEGRPDEGEHHAREDAVDETEAILEALRAVWRDWSGARRTFRNEPEMQCEMR